MYHIGNALFIIKMNLDSVDIVILDSLQKHGRMSNVRLAEKAGISAPPCLRRFKLMEHQGVLVGYHAVVNPELLGFTIKAFCAVSLTSQSTETVSSFLKIVEREPCIRSCFSTSGNEVFILTIVAKNLKAYEGILHGTLQSSGFVSNITSYILLNKHKDEFGIPLDVSGKRSSQTRV